MLCVALDGEVFNLYYTRVLFSTNVVNELMFYYTRVLFLANTANELKSVVKNLGNIRELALLLGFVVFSLDAKTTVIFFGPWRSCESTFKPGAILLTSLGVKFQNP